MNNYLLMVASAVLVALAGYFGQLIKKPAQRYLDFHKFLLKKNSPLPTAVRGNFCL